MSRSVDIDLTFGPPVRLEALLSGLAGSDWSPVRDGKINSMVDYDWQYVGAGNASGFWPQWPGHSAPERGRDLTMDDRGPRRQYWPSPGGEKVSLILDLSRRLYEGSAMFTDLGWYLAGSCRRWRVRGCPAALRDTYP